MGLYICIVTPTNYTPYIRSMLFALTRSIDRGSYIALLRINTNWRGAPQKATNPFPLILNPPKPPIPNPHNIVPICHKGEVSLLRGGEGFSIRGKGLASIFLSRATLELPFQSGAGEEALLHLPTNS